MNSVCFLIFGFLVMVVGGVSDVVSDKSVIGERKYFG